MPLGIGFIRGPSPPCNNHVSHDIVTNASRHWVHKGDSRPARNRDRNRVTNASRHWVHKGVGAKSCFRLPLNLSQMPLGIGFIRGELIQNAFPELSASQMPLGIGFIRGQRRSSSHYALPAVTNASRHWVHKGVRSTTLTQLRQ